LVWNQSEVKEKQKEKEKEKKEKRPQLSAKKERTEGKSLLHLHALLRPLQP
jgi:hypothetical protein